MPKVAIVTDSTCDTPEAWSYQDRLHILPIHIRFGDETFLEGIDIDEKGFYDRVEEDGAIPKTSQPNPSEFAELYQKLAADYDAIISMHVTAKLSGTYQSAVMAAELVRDDIAVHPFDSAGGSAQIGFMAEEAFEMFDAGSSLSDVMAKLESIRSNTQIFLTPDTLKYAQMSGRVSAMGSAMASLLNIKPIVVLREGELFADERVRTRKRALRQIVDMMVTRMGETPIKLAAVHAGAPEDAEKLRQLATDHLHTETVWVTSLATSIAVHLGPGTVGLIAYKT